MSQLHVLAKKYAISLQYLILILFFVNVNPALANENSAQKLTLCWHEGYPYAGPNLPEGGLVTDFVRTVMIEAGYEPEMIFVPWARCKAGVTNGRYDLLFAMWNFVDQHQENYDFLKPTNIENTSFVVLDDSPLTSAKLNSLQDVKLALHIDGGYDRKTLNHKGFTFSYVGSDILKLKLLFGTRVDLAIGDPVRFDYYKRRNFKREKRKIRELLPAIRTQHSSPAISKLNPRKDEIIKRYNAAYARLCLTGDLKRIITKYGFDFEPVACH